jgi:hypothetical protein
MPEPVQDVDDEGPWLAAAVFCESVIEDHNGARSLIRLHHGGEFFDAQKSAAYAEPVLFLSFIGGKRRGRFSVEIVGRVPGRSPRQVAVIQFALDGPGSGHDAYALVHIAADVEGIAWFDILLDGRLLTRVAYRILHIADRRAADADVE